MRLAILFIAASALAACGGPDRIAENAENVSALPTLNQPTASPTGGPPANAVRTEPPRPSADEAEIPPALRGRWGLTPRDCTSPLGDAKGLLVINAEELRFYESRGVPTNVQTSDDSISGDFAFIGEGQEWTRHVTLELRGGRLVRTERDPVSSFRYVRC